MVPLLVVCLFYVSPAFRKRSHTVDIERDREKERKRRRGVRVNVVLNPGLSLSVWLSWSGDIRVDAVLAITVFDRLRDISFFFSIPIVQSSVFVCGTESLNKLQVSLYAQCKCDHYRLPNKGEKTTKKQTQRSSVETKSSMVLEGKRTKCSCATDWKNVHFTKIKWSGPDVFATVMIKNLIWACRLYKKTGKFNAGFLLICSDGLKRLNGAIMM